MKEVQRKDTPAVGGGAYMPTPALPGGPIVTPTFPEPGYPPNPITPIEPVTGTQKL